MSGDEKQEQIREAIEEYASLKQELAHISKRLSDFSNHAIMAANAVAPGTLDRQKGATPQQWKALLNGEELSKLLAEYFAAKDRLASLAEFLKTVGYGGLVN